MKILLSGICGFAGSNLAHGLLDLDSTLKITGVDNFSRAGSHLNIDPLRQRGVKLVHADLRSASDLDSIAAIDWIIDAAANPSVLAGIDGTTSSRQLLEHNLYGTVNLLELAKRYRAGFVLLSTSRVYSIRGLASIPVVVKNDAFAPDASKTLPPGVSPRGVTEAFSTTPPLSLYGSSKLASEAIALEYGETFEFPVWINRCGVLAGAGQFGRGDQGIFSFWINSYLRRKPLKYIGFDGAGHQTRDCLHPRDLLPVLEKQFASAETGKPRVVNFGGGMENSMSLAQLSKWCADRFGPHPVTSDAQPRPFDVPWLAMDSSLAGETWAWRPAQSLETILDEIARHAEANPRWLETSATL
ncbi:MAG: CDP-tyvelose epimerase [Verrucomicrobia bacterium]|nr:MAG: CDP-tyvelose epimerase [Verrucomicrobiota bacterium]